MRKIGMLMAALPLLAGAAPNDIAGTLEVDPVELVKGNEVAGDPEISATHYRFRYLFANEKNRTEFLKNPEKYEIQLGGACARMGALSGLGKTDLYATHNGKIFIFASQACKDTFLRDPTKVLDRPDPVPVGSDAAKQKAHALLEKAARAMAGAQGIDAVNVYQQQKTKQSEAEGNTYNVVDTVTLEFPDRIRIDHVWGDNRYTTVVTEDDAWKKNPENVFTLHPQQRQAAETIYFGRNLLAILKARNEPDFTAVHTGRNRIEVKGTPTDLELINIHYRDATNILGIDPDSGRILMQAYLGRGPDLTLGMVQKFFANFQSVDGVLLPQETTLHFNGEKVEPSSDTKVTTALNVDLPQNFFRRPTDH